MCTHAYIIFSYLVLALRYAFTSNSNLKGSSFCSLPLAVQIFYVKIFDLVKVSTASCPLECRARDFLMREGIFPSDGINMPEFQRERAARTEARI